jgi:hypothetical protein
MAISRDRVVYNKISSQRENKRDDIRLDKGTHTVSN